MKVKKYEKGGKRARNRKTLESLVDFDMNLPSVEARSKNMNVAKKILRSKLMAQYLGDNYSGPAREGMEIPSIQVFQDNKTGEYIARPKLQSRADK